jgi:hypothetical protein
MGCLCVLLSQVGEKIIQYLYSVRYTDGTSWADLDADMTFQFTKLETTIPRRSLQ